MYEMIFTKQIISQIFFNNILCDSRIRIAYVCMHGIYAVIKFCSILQQTGESFAAVTEKEFLCAALS
jgi:hypothetical protein